MHVHSLFAAALMLTFGASEATAQEPSPPPDNAAQNKPVNTTEMQKHASEMCDDHYARIVGAMSYLEVRLALSDSQRPLFDHWKSLKLADAKAHRADCAVRKPPNQPPPIIDLLNLEEKMIRARLEEVKTEIPLLEALSKTLSEDQKRRFERNWMMAAMRPNAGPPPFGPPRDNRRPGTEEMNHDAPPPPPDGGPLPMQ
jgi:hypothetical protein